MGIDCGETRAAMHTMEHECEDEVIEVGVRMFAWVAMEQGEIARSTP